MTDTGGMPEAPRANAGTGASDRPTSNAASAGRFRSWGATHPGAVRSRNEDAFVNRPDLGVWAVADGAGGHSDGGVAARMIAEALDAIPPSLGAGELLGEVRSRIEATHAALRDAAARRGGRTIIASTVVVLMIRNDHFACLWAGDSRAYLLRDGAMLQVTRDHSLVQELVDAGAIRPEEAEGHPRANVITRAVGAEADVPDLDKVSDRLRPSDRFLLCSDGLSKTLPDAQAAQILGADEDSPAERLLLAALAMRANDNVTCVAVEIVGDDNQPGEVGDDAAAPADGHSAGGDSDQTMQIRPERPDPAQ